MNKKINKIKGFTLIELLVVVSIIGILTIIALGSYTNAQVKARDSRRKSDLDAVSKALMMYYNDVGNFPGSFTFGNSTVGFTGPNGIVYMRETPLDPRSVGVYQYVYKTDGVSFNLFANLENMNDSQCSGHYTVGVGTSYCYGLASPNTVVKNW